MLAKRSIGSELIRAGLTVLVASAAAMFVGELALRALSPDRYYVYPPGLTRTFTPLPDVMPGVSGDSRFIINESGIRGPSFSENDAFRILAVGGSTTECLYLDQSEAWPQVLQEKLNLRRQQSDLWVGNVGKSGHDARHHTLQVERLLDQYPRIDVVLLLVGVNDMRFWLNSYENSRLAEERYVTNDTVLDEAFLVRPGRTVEFERRGEFQGWRCVSCGDPFYKRTEMWRRLRAVKRRYFPSSENVLIQDEAGSIYISARQRRRTAKKEEHLPDLTAGLAAYARNIHRIIDAVQSRQARIVLITQPSLWTREMSPELEDLLFMGGPIAEHPGQSEVYYSTAVLAEAMDQYNSELLRVCDARAVACVDLASKMPKDTKYFYDDVHFNEAGAARVAQILADHLATEAFGSIRRRS
jgi:lysophospholipase L1-like esterase